MSKRKGNEFVEQLASLCHDSSTSGILLPENTCSVKLQCNSDHINTEELTHIQPIQNNYPPVMWVLKKKEEHFRYVLIHSV